MPGSSPSTWRRPRGPQSPSSPGWRWWPPPRCRAHRDAGLEEGVSFSRAVDELGIDRRLTGGRRSGAVPHRVNLNAFNTSKGLADTDGDGVVDAMDDDVDGDGKPNWMDMDVDGDGVPNWDDAADVGATPSRT